MRGGVLVCGLFLLAVDGVLLGNRIELLHLEFLARVFFVLVVKTGVVRVSFANTVLIAFGHQPDH